MSALNADSLVLSTSELALVAELGGVRAPWDPPVLGAEGWLAVLAGLRARGIVERTHDGDRLAEVLRPLLGVALLAERVIRSRADSGDDGRDGRLMISDGLAAELERGGDGLVRLTAVDPVDLAARIDAYGGEPA